MKKIIVIVLASLMALTMLFGCAKKEEGETETFSGIDLVKDGKTEYSILLPENAEDMEQTAASELQTFF